MGHVNTKLVALCTAAACALSTAPAPAPAHAAPNDLGLVREHQRPLLSSTRLDAIPIVLLGTLMGGLLGRLLYSQFVFEGSSRVAGALGSSSVVKHTFPDPDAPPAQFRSLEHVQDNVWNLTVYSPSMDAEVENDVILPPGGLDNTSPRPTFYLIAGAGGGEGTPWWSDGGAAEFFKDKHVNVVTPRASIGNQQADWARPDPKAGALKWTTYLSKELPPLIDATFHGTGTDAIAGLSASGAAALEIAGLEDRFVAAGTYSSCPSTTGVLGQAFTSSTVRYLLGDPENMWGKPWDPAWAAHSPVLHLDKLRGKTLFLTASRGVPSDTDVEDMDSPEPLLAPNEQLDYTCSLHFLAQSRKAGLDPDWYEFEEGTHNFGVFRRALVASWATIGPALGL